MAGRYVRGEELERINREYLGLVAERDALAARVAEVEEQRNAILNYWFPILGYRTANEMVYPVVGDRRATPPPNVIGA